MLTRTLGLAAAVLVAACAAHDKPNPARPTYADAPPHGRTHVLLVTGGGGAVPYVEMALLAGDDVDLTRLTPREFDDQVARGTVPRDAVIVLDDHTPARLPPAPVRLLYFHPSGEHAPFRLGRQLTGVAVDRIEGEHAVMRDVAIAESRLDAASALSVNPARGEVSLAAAGTDTVIAGRSGAGGRVVACSFRPTDTAWSMQATFAVFVHNAVDWLAAAAP